MSGAQHENWEESNRAESSSHTDTSTDVDPDEKNQQVFSHLNPAVPFFFFLASKSAFVRLLLTLATNLS